MPRPKNSDYWGIQKVKKVKLLVAQLCPTLCDLWTVARQIPRSVGFPRQEYWSRLPFPQSKNLCPILESLRGPGSWKYVSSKRRAPWHPHPQESSILNGIGALVGPIFELRFHHIHGALLFETATICAAHKAYGVAGHGGPCVGSNH